MSDWPNIVATVMDADRWPKPAARELLQQRLVANGGALSRNEALVLSERTGWSSRQMYRWRSEWAAAAPRPDPDANFVERISEHGPSEFVFDDLALTMLYLTGGNMARFRAEVVAAGYQMPSLATLSRLWRAQVPRQVRDGAKHGHKNRHTNLFFVRHTAAAPDDAWQLDAFSLDLRVRVEDDCDPSEEDAAVDVPVRKGRRWMKFRPQLLLLIDDCSRFITGWALLDHEPTAADTCTLLADAFEVRPSDDGSGVDIGGPCDQLVCDNARAFRSHLVEGMMTGLGVGVAPTPVFSPAAKGKVERVGQTIQANVVTGLAGVVTRAERLNMSHAMEVPSQHWLEFDQLEAIVAEVVHIYNYETVHSALGTTPFERYAQRTGPRAHFADETLAEHYQRLAWDDGKRRLQKSGVFVFGEYWLGTRLDENLIGDEVVVKSLHHRLDRLAVFDSDDHFIGMVKRSSTFDADERSLLTSRRLETGKAVSRFSKRARAALEVRTAGVAAGEGTSKLEAVKAVFSGESPMEPTPMNERGETPHAQPASRPPSQNNDTTQVTPAAPSESGGGVSAADREAILDAKARIDAQAAKGRRTGSRGKGGES
jgi:transposase InsO family protein